MNYRGRLAPTPPGYLHLGHARTFWIAQERARAASGALLYRNENLDSDRCKPEYTEAAMEDCRWIGLNWEGDVLHQSDRLGLYREAFEQLKQSGYLFPCTCTRRDLENAVAAPHGEGGETIYPGTCREQTTPPEADCNWRFRVSDGEHVTFEDAHYGPQQFVAGRDFGDFPVWQKNGMPSYQLAVVVDDAAQEITEVVRGADLLVSTARQLLLYRALELIAPSFYHCDLMLDAEGNRLAKRNKALSLRELRTNGKTPEEVRKEWI